jgi:hypothetical protein
MADCLFKTGRLPFQVPELLVDASAFYPVDSLFERWYTTNEEKSLVEVKRAL